MAVSVPFTGFGQAVAGSTQGFNLQCTFKLPETAA